MNGICRTVLVNWQNREVLAFRNRILHRMNKNWRHFQPEAVDF